MVCMIDRVGKAPYNRRGIMWKPIPTRSQQFTMVKHPFVTNSLSQIKYGIHFFNLLLKNEQGVHSVIPIL